MCAAFAVNVTLCFSRINATGGSVFNLRNSQTGFQGGRPAGGAQAARAPRVWASPPLATRAGWRRELLTRQFAFLQQLVTLRRHLCIFFGKFLLKSFAHFLTAEFRELFIYTGYKSSVRCVTCKYFLSVSNLCSQPLNRDFCRG